MQFPIWEVPFLGGGMIIAIISIVHVTIAHFSVGAGFFFVVTEQRALKSNNTVLLRFLRDFSFYFILLSFVLGALTGVGIWFAISLVSPDATSALIHQFVWGWATEWVFFFVEIIAGYIYYYTWDRMEPRKHVIIGWIYAISAFMSLVIINGILTFMLTPGAWLETRDFWDGILNPTYWPSLFLRTISALSLAAIVVCIVANIAKGYTREERHTIITEGGRWLIPLALMIPVSIWYMAYVPEEARRLIQGGAIAMTLFFAFGLVTSTLIGLYAYYGLIIKRRYINLETAVLLGLIAFISTGSMEFVREGIRKPFIIYGYMYSNGILVSQLDEFDETGTIGWAPWATLAVTGATGEPPDELRGEVLYNIQCARCHTLDGTNGIRPLIRNWPRESLRHSIDNLHTEQYFMPPFAGPERDREAITDYLLQLSREE